jgi:hypothetical protein
MSSSECRFHLFPTLPVEIRLKIWRLTLPPRVVEVQLHVPSESDPAISEMSLDLRPLAHPSLPVIFHVCQESRDEALSIYRPCSGSTFASPHAFPYNLYHPVLDTLFIPISLYTVEAYLPQNVFSAASALSLGMPREFILDRLAVNPSDVASIGSLAISWADMHVKDMATLIEALEPFKAFREQSLVLFEKRRDNQDIRLMSMKRGQLRAVLVEPSESTVRGRYLERILEEYTELCTMFNAVFLEMNALKGVKGRGRLRKLPEVKVKMVRFEG